MKDSKRRSGSRKNQKGGPTGPKTTGSARAGVIFPVGRLNRLLRQGRYAPRVGGSAGAFMAGALEYIAAEVLELAGE